MSWQVNSTRLKFPHLKMAHNVQMKVQTAKDVLWYVFLFAGQKISALHKIKFCQKLSVRITKKNTLTGTSDLEKAAVLNDFFFISFIVLPKYRDSFKRERLLE